MARSKLIVISNNVITNGHTMVIISNSIPRWLNPVHDGGSSWDLLSSGEAACCIIKFLVLNLKKKLLAIAHCSVVFTITHSHPANIRAMGKKLLRCGWAGIILILDTIGGDHTSQSWIISHFTNLGNLGHIPDMNPPNSVESIHSSVLVPQFDLWTGTYDAERGVTIKRKEMTSEILSVSNIRFHHIS